MRNAIESNSKGSSHGAPYIAATCPLRPLRSSTIKGMAHVGSGVLTAGLIVIGLVVSRQFFTMMDNHRLSLQLVEFNEELETTVTKRPTNFRRSMRFPLGRQFSSSRGDPTSVPVPLHASPLRKRRHVGIQKDFLPDSSEEGS